MRRLWAIPRKFKAATQVRINLVAMCPEDQQHCHQPGPTNASASTGDDASKLLINQSLWHRCRNHPVAAALAGAVLLLSGSIAVTMAVTHGSAAARDAAIERDVLSRLERARRWQLGRLDDASGEISDARGLLRAPAVSCTEN